MTQAFKADTLAVHIFPDREALGLSAAQEVAGTLRQLLETKTEVNMVFAAAPSQAELLSELKLEKGIDWSRVNAFHMDEYVGLPDNAPQRFGNFLKAAIFDTLPLQSVHYLDGNGGEAACVAYAALLENFPTDIVLMGIGENGHLAFNDPPVADFNDAALVKIVELDPVCRQQQVNDGCFDDIDQVPTHAMTLTIPALMQASYVYCVVPGPAKATAVYNTINQPIETQYPSTILRTHHQAILFLDAQSSQLICIEKA